MTIQKAIEMAGYTVAPGAQTNLDEEEIEAILYLIAGMRDSRDWLKRLEYAIDTETLRGGELQDEFWDYLKGIGLREVKA